MKRKLPLPVSKAEVFNFRVALQRADDILALPPKLDWIDRPEPVGELVCRFAVPLELAPAVNVYAEKRRWQHAQVKRACLGVMLVQLRDQPDFVRPLSGRPMVRAIRFSSNEGDGDSAWSKVPVDRLVELGILQDDRRSKCDLRCHWEPTAPGKGFVLLEVFSGKP